MFKKWEAAHRELGAFVWSEGSIPEFRQSGGQGLSERRARDAKRKTFNEKSEKLHLSWRKKYIESSAKSALRMA